MGVFHKILRKLSTVNLRLSGDRIRNVFFLEQHIASVSDIL